MPSSTDMSKRHRVLARHVHEEAVGGDRRGRHEHADQLAIVAARDVGRGLAGNEADRPDAVPRILDQHDLAKGARGLRQRGLEQLLQGRVDAAHDRRAVEQLLAGAHDRASDHASGEPADQDQQTQHDQQADARQTERQVGLGVVGGRDERRDRPVDVAQHLPDDEQGDGDRRRDDDAGQQVVAQPVRQATRCRSVQSHSAHPAVSHRRRHHSAPRPGRNRATGMTDRANLAGILTNFIRQSIYHKIDSIF